MTIINLVHSQRASQANQQQVFFFQRKATSGQQQQIHVTQNDHKQPNSPNFQSWKRCLKNRQAVNVPIHKGNFGTIQQIKPREIFFHHRINEVHGESAKENSKTSIGIQQIDTYGPSKKFVSAAITALKNRKPDQNMSNKGKDPSDQHIEYLDHTRKYVISAKNHTLKT